MNRLFLLVAITSVMLFSLLACGTDTAPADKAQPAATSEDPAAKSADPSEAAVAGVAIFPDETLASAIRAEIGQPEGPILISDLESITELDVSFQLNIADLSGMEHLVNLTELHLATNEVSDLTPLATLIKLTWLNLDQNQISDISPLAGLTNLTWLSLLQNEVSDISSMSKLTELTYLSLRQNEVIDISPLSSATKLTELNLTNNHVSDLSPLTSVNDLMMLTLANNEVSDLSPLLNAGLPEGATIRLWGEPLDTNSIEVVIPKLEAAGVKVQK